MMDVTTKGGNGQGGEPPLLPHGLPALATLLYTPLGFKECECVPSFSVTKRRLSASSRCHKPLRLPHFFPQEAEIVLSFWHTKQFYSVLIRQAFDSADGFIRHIFQRHQGDGFVVKHHVIMFVTNEIDSIFWALVF